MIEDQGIASVEIERKRSRQTQRSMVFRSLPLRAKTFTFQNVHTTKADKYQYNYSLCIYAPFST